MTNQKVSFKYILSTILIVFFTWIFHEFIHWITGELLGHESIMRLNATGFKNPKDVSEVDSAIISISAPIATLLQGIIAYVALKKREWKKALYPVLFTAFYMRLLVGIMNIFQPNDEARVSLYLGLGTYTLSIVISAILFWMVYRVSKANQLKFKFHLWTVLTVIVSSSLLIIVDMFFRIRLI